eukprot:scaffold30907_cov61-Cyclotella_meneghiniana.AAC.5
MKLSTPAFLASAIAAGFDHAAEAAATSTDFTMHGRENDGECKDQNGEHYTYVHSPYFFKKWPGLASASSLCARWCGQYISSEFVGMNVENASHQWWCHCLYDMPNSELEVFPYTHKPAAFRSDFHDGTGEISQTVAPYTYGSAPYTATCFKYTPASATRIKYMGATQGL